MSARGVDPRLAHLRARTNRAPIFFARCPVHGRKVARDGTGTLLGVCDGCARDCARAMGRLAEMAGMTVMVDHPVPVAWKKEYLAGQKGHAVYPTARVTICGIESDPAAHMPWSPSCKTCEMVARLWHDIDGSAPEAWGWVRRPKGWTE